MSFTDRIKRADWLINTIIPFVKRNVARRGKPTYDKLKVIWGEDVKVFHTNFKPDEDDWVASHSDCVMRITGCPCIRIELHQAEGDYERKA